MRKFKAEPPIRKSYVRKNGQEVWIPLQDWTEEEIADYLRRYEAAFRRRCKTQKQR